MIARVASIGAALVLGVMGAVVLASPAQAQEAEFTAPCGYAFTANDWLTGAGGQPSVVSTVSTWSVTLNKVNGTVGTDATADLNATGVNTLSVRYALSNGADTAGTVIRFFAYDHPDADTAMTAPTYGPVVASGTSGEHGTLELNIGGGDVGTVGVTYDAGTSNTGTVEFFELRLNGEKIRFIGEECPTTPPTTEPPVTEEPTEEPTEPPVAGGGGAVDKPNLPVTGLDLPIVAGAGAVLLGLGGGLYLLARNRRQLPVEGGE